ncbi:bifunctional DNA-binding transcriptional regulator/O6-methylguanine-DNA methyltransferase Ada [Aurantiacibacter sp. MUD11]|uniref:bifunctional DNA-binding transcriptional regulator/O6-methylguanine-DNA methyltransferase Ada n=1 Tax=Aurantiacibacter sp. MUD11 TaxID=3003265 RepID=UPI0022AA6137|nr:bifunctional DNA-binding transcriptional regulator/O6-methylguanine-DNA methyltransferase Ada [Aurantiacibacter sp. MUD11]WAT18746.1 bifunctional DNA-binding transcriptional regulator/O6-methylguanine-DNA methyltransferase Ada [Aurantiacibacter sp. MUD11]
MTDKPLTDDDRWQIALAKDRRFDGVFVTGVHSTGIYCRPSCPARAPKRENVRFYATPDAAEAAGLRACKRCAPDQQSREEGAVLRVLEILRDAEGPVSLESLGAATDYSPTHLQRVFTRAVGMSPAAYSRALRRERAGEALSREDRVTDAIYEAGYGAPSRFYEDMKGSGMTPSDWRDGGAGRTINYALVETTLGQMLVAASEKGVCTLSFNEGVEELRVRFPKAELMEGGNAFRDLLDRVIAAVEAPGTGQDIPLDVKGTVFQQRVWEALRQIPAGETLSYGELAAKLGKPKASRAVGGANGANNIAVLIPCHRVIAADGSLGGYAYGLEIKAELLRREGKATD